MTPDKQGKVVQQKGSGIPQNTFSKLTLYHGTLISPSALFGSARGGALRPGPGLAVGLAGWPHWGFRPCRLGRLGPTRITTTKMTTTKMGYNSNELEELRRKRNYRKQLEELLEEPRRALSQNLFIAVSVALASCPRCDATRSAVRRVQVCWLSRNKVAQS